MRIELTHKGFADLSLTTWVPRPKAVTSDKQTAFVLARHLSLITRHCFQARYPSGKGEVCKTFMREFDSHPRLHSLRQLSLP